MRARPIDDGTLEELRSWRPATEAKTEVWTRNGFGTCAGLLPWRELIAQLIQKMPALFINLKYLCDLLNTR